MEIEIRKSSRKSIGIEVTASGQVIVRAPMWMSKREILHYVELKKEWIEESLKKVAIRREEKKTLPVLTQADIERLAQEALQVIPERTAYYASLLGVTYGRITIRNQKTRWGSCSSRGNLNFNCLLMLVPEPEKNRILDYVIVHELCHRKHMDHSADFWAQVEEILPDYRVRRKWLKDHGASIMGSLI